MTGRALKSASGFLILKSFQNFNKLRISDGRIIGDNWQVKISGGCGNKPVMQFGDVVDLGSGFKNLKAQRFKLIILGCGLGCGTPIKL